MTETIREALPFTEKPGTFYMAPVGAALPDMTIKRRRFVEDWGRAWLMVGKTNHKACRAEKVVDRVTVGPVVYGVGLDDDKRRWTFDLSDVYMRPANLAELDLMRTYVMLGWESEDDRDRAVAMQAKPAGADRFFRPAGFTRTYELETTLDGKLFTIYYAAQTPSNRGR